MSNPDAKSQADRRQRMNQLLERYVADTRVNVGKLAADLASAMKAGNPGDPWDEIHVRSVSEAVGIVHKLAGSGATMGFPALSANALPLERFLIALAARGRVPDRAESDQLNVFLGGLQSAAERMDVADPLERLAAMPSCRPTTPQSGDGARKLVLVLRDAEKAKDLSEQIGHFGYEVAAVAGGAELENLAAAEPPQMVVMDLEDGEAEAKALLRIGDALQNKHGTQLVAVSSRGDLGLRLAAVRAGVGAYFTKPFQLGNLLDTLDHLTRRETPDIYRVLIVDDDAILAGCYADILQQAGMATETVTDPKSVMAPLADFRPDLILLDLHMPECSGLELAAVLRQQDAYVGIPVVFLSTETSIAGHLAAMSLGGDDFLMKPVQPDYLVTAVSARIARSRILRAMISKDSLTGLLNHTHLADQLDAELSRAERFKQPLAFAMIDLDHFKKVNDTYGHGAGDRVLQSLARLMRQRLRRSDYIGRYGGEEFAVILTQTDEERAKIILDDLRETFGKIEQRAGDKTFHVTLCCGIAGYPRIAEPMRLRTAADAALYAAKKAGRNQVVVSTEV